MSSLRLRTRLFGPKSSSSLPVRTRIGLWSGEVPSLSVGTRLVPWNVFGPSLLVHSRIGPWSVWAPGADDPCEMVGNPLVGVCAVILIFILCLYRLYLLELSSM